VDGRPAVVVEISGQNTQAEGAVHLGDAGRLGDISESSIPVVVIENVFSAGQSRWTASNSQALVETRSGFGHRRRRQIQIDVVGNEQVKIAVAIVIHKGATCSPTRGLSGDSGFVTDIRKRAVSIILIEHILT